MNSTSWADEEDYYPAPRTSPPQNASKPVEKPPEEEWHEGMEVNRGKSRMRLDMSHGFMKDIIRNQETRKAYEQEWEKATEAGQPPGKPLDFDARTNTRRSDSRAGPSSSSRPPPPLSPRDNTQQQQAEQRPQPERKPVRIREGFGTYRPPSATSGQSRLSDQERREAAHGPPPGINNNGGRGQRQQQQQQQRGGGGRGGRGGRGPVPPPPAAEEGTRPYVPLSEAKSLDDIYFPPALGEVDTRPRDPRRRDTRGGRGRGRGRGRRGKEEEREFVQPLPITISNNGPPPPPPSAASASSGPLPEKKKKNRRQRNNKNKPAAESPTAAAADAVAQLTLNNTNNKDDDENVVLSTKPPLPPPPPSTKPSPNASSSTLAPSAGPSGVIIGRTDSSDSIGLKAVKDIMLGSTPSVPSSPAAAVTLQESDRMESAASQLAPVTEPYLVHVESSESSNEPSVSKAGGMRVQGSVDSFNSTMEELPVPVDGDDTEESGTDEQQPQEEQANCVIQ